MGLFDINRAMSYRRNDPTIEGFIDRVCSVNDNDYIPVYACNCFIKRSESILDYVIIYPEGFNYEDDTKNFRSNINYGSGRKYFYEKDNLTVYAMKGFVYTISNGVILPLMVSVLRSDMYLAGFPANMMDKFKLLIHPHVFTNSKYSRVMYYIKKYFIEEADSRGVEVVLTSNISDYCFNPSKIRVNSSSISELNDTLSSYKSLIANEGDRVLPEYIIEEPVQELVIVDDTEEVEEGIPDGLSIDTSELSIDGLTITQVTPSEVTPPTVDEFTDAEEQVVSGNFTVADGFPIPIGEGFAVQQTGTIQGGSLEVGDVTITDSSGNIVPADITNVEGWSIIRPDDTEVVPDRIMATGLALQASLDENGNTHSRVVPMYGFTDDESQILNYD